MDEKNKEVKEIHFKLNKMESEVAKTCKESLMLFVVNFNTYLEMVK